MQTEPAYYDIGSAERYSGKSKSTLRRAVRRGQLAAFRVGVGQPRFHRLTFRKVDLDTWLQQEPATPTTHAIVNEIVKRVTGP